jgi:hypothetical protein
MKSHCLFLALGVLLGAGPFSTHAEVFNTGLDATGAPLAPGAIDPHWQIVASADPFTPGPNAYVVANNGGASWVPDSSTSRWIGPKANQSTSLYAGDYRYRTTFDLTGYDLARVKLQLTIAADNKVPSVRLNGAPTLLTFSNGFQQFITKFLTSGFVPGVNTLEIDVGNFTTGGGPSPTGLRCELRIIDTDEDFSLHLGLQSPNVVMDWSPVFGCCGVESTTDLSSGLWTAIETAPTMVNGRLTLSVPPAGETGRFFRLKQRPGPPGPVVWVNEQYGADYLDFVAFNDPISDFPFSAVCDAGTGCQLRWPLDGTIVNEFDASRSLYDFLCITSEGPLQYEWKFRYPPTIQGGAYYSAPTVTGKNTAHVTIPPNAFPGLIGADVMWRVILTITKNTPTGVVTWDAVFRFQYDSSELQCCPL